VGQPVTKVVNPHTGTVITVSAEEEEDVINSNQEYDSAAEEIHAPRSVCAEEGPASLGTADLSEEPESRALNRELTEICAEMRSASEPAIDSVSDENIRELKERRALCAEMMHGGRNPSSIDFEKEEAFRDVPISLSLCAEQGEIPSSPMTQAKETALWCSKDKAATKREDHNKIHERNLAKAKYVVNYDDDSVTLMENKTMRSEKSYEAMQSNLDEQHVTRMSKKFSAEKNIVDSVERTSKKFMTNTNFTQKHPIEQQTVCVEKYIVKEDKDSIIIEDAQSVDSIVNAKDAMAKKNEKKTNDIDKKRNENMKNVNKTMKSHKNKSKSCISLQNVCSDNQIISEGKEAKKTKEEISSDSSEVKSQETDTKETLVKLVSKIGKMTLLKFGNNNDNDDELPSLDPPPLDDFSSIEYHMVEPCSGKDTTSTATQSDDDIEHINESEVMQMRAKADGKYKDADAINACITQSSPVTQRKNSKSTISDDDLEYIQSSELSFDSMNLERGDTVRKNDSCSRRRQSKYVLSSDDDLEHVQHSEIHELEFDVMAKLPKECPTMEEAISIEQQELKSSRSSRKKDKDIMVIEKNDEEAAEVTVVYPLKDTWLRSEEIDKYGSVEDQLKDKPEETYPSPTRRIKNRSSKTNYLSSSSSSLPGKRIFQTTSDIVEIIDIDALQKADMDTDMMPECKILPGTRAKKSHKSKKSHSESQQENNSTELPITTPPSLHSSKVRMAELQEAVQEELLIDSLKCDEESKAEASSSIEISWSSVVKKSISSSSESQEIRKEIDLEPLIEVEEKSEIGEHVRKHDEIKLYDKGNLLSVTCTTREQENTRRRVSETKEMENKIDETTTTPTTIEENLLVDLSAAIPIVDEPRLDKDIVSVTTNKAYTEIRWGEEDNERTEDSSLLASEVQFDEIRRGNLAAERKESQRESSLQLQPRQVESNSASGQNPVFSKEVRLESDHHKSSEKRNEEQIREVPKEHPTTARKPSGKSKRKKRR
jgi:hypothetical protein